MFSVECWGWDFLLVFSLDSQCVRIHPISMPVGDMRINWQVPKLLVSDVWGRRLLLSIKK
jgi:hypothetical protein